jgi:hypothetical protein
MGKFCEAVSGFIPVDNQKKAKEVNQNTGSRKHLRITIFKVSS